MNIMYLYSGKVSPISFCKLLDAHQLLTYHLIVSDNTVKCHNDSREVIQPKAPATQLSTLRPRQRTRPKALAQRILDSSMQPLPQLRHLQSTPAIVDPSSRYYVASSGRAQGPGVQCTPVALSWSTLTSTHSSGECSTGKLLCVTEGKVEREGWRLSSLRSGSHGLHRASSLVWDSKAPHAPSTWTGGARLARRS